MPDQEERYQQLGVAKNPEDWTWIEAGKYKDYSDYAKKSILQDAIVAANRHGISSYDLMGLLGAESGYGNKYPGNPTQIDLGQHGKALTALTNQGVYKQDEGTKNFLDYSARLLKQGFQRFPTDRLKALQSYSGISGGRAPQISEPGNYSRFYRRFGRELPHGRKVDYFSNFLQDNPDIQNLVYQTLIGGKDVAPADVMPSKNALMEFLWGQGGGN